ncbi:hypothetical protein V6N13_041622 [Hibiscus sabdariffa]
MFVHQISTHRDPVVKEIICDVSVIFVPAVAPVVSNSIAIDSILKGKEQVHVASSVIDSAMKDKVQNVRFVITSSSNKFSGLATPVGTVLSDPIYVHMPVEISEDDATGINGAYVQTDSSLKKTRAVANGVTQLI